jgi:hypothetical protein
MPKDQGEHRREVERASVPDCDGLRWFGDRVWPDGHLWTQLFWTYYASHIAPHNHGRALRALAAATPDGVKAIGSSTELRALLKRVIGPFWEKPHQRRRREEECPYCTRPYEASKQCLGCGAWRRA